MRSVVVLPRALYLAEWQTDTRLFLPSATQRFAGSRGDQMRLLAGRTGYYLESLPVVVGGTIGKPGLNVQARGGTTVDHGSHELHSLQSNGGYCHRVRIGQSKRRGRWLAVSARDLT